MKSSPHDRAALGFPDCVEHEFGFLRDLGFKTRRMETTLIRFESDRLSIDVTHGRESYEIGLSIGPVAGDSYPMGTLLSLRDPAAARAYRRFAASSPAAVRRGVAELARLLKGCAASGLLSDPTLLQRLWEASGVSVNEYANEVHLADIRKKLQAAWDVRDYSQVMRLLAPVEGLLTRVERKKLEYARARAGLVQD